MFQFCLSRSRLTARWGPFLVVAGFLFACGCQSGGKTSGSRFAWVEIQGNTPGQINAMAIDIFRAHGYQALRTGATTLAFEKKATSFSNFTYGNWGDETSLIIRVKTSLVAVGDQSFMLQCQAYMVRDPGGSTEEELKMSNLKRHTFQELLDEVARSLKPPLSDRAR